MDNGESLSGNFTFPSEPILHELIKQFPVPLAFITSDNVVTFLNDRFCRSFEGARLDSSWLAQAGNCPSDDWTAIGLTSADGHKVHARVRSISAHDGSKVVVVDDVPNGGFLTAFEELQRKVAELERRCSTDGMTGLWNRLHFDSIIESELSRCTRSKQPVSLIIIDIDHFKRVNDSFGHQTGDAVIREITKLMRAQIRASDSLFRWGGEEFVVLATATGYRSAESLAEKLRATVEEHAFESVGQLTVSIGVAEYLGTESADGLFGRGDAALYVAKAGGRNKVHVDRCGCSDTWAAKDGQSLLQLTWHEAYECGEPTIDAEHRLLFDLANSLIAAAISKDTNPGAFHEALEGLLLHLGKHFANEEIVLAQRNYKDYELHKLAHARLLDRAATLKTVAKAGKVSFGALTEFLVRDVVARHIFKMDSQFYPLFQTTI